MPIPNGIYDINSLNVTFTNLTSALNSPNGLFYIEPLSSTAQIAIFFYDYSNTQLKFQTNGDNILDILGFTNNKPSKFQPNSISSYALSTNKAMLNNISEFIITCDCLSGSYNNSQTSYLFNNSTVNVSPYSTQEIAPYHLIYNDIFKHIINTMTISLTSDGVSNFIDMTGGTYIDPELFSLMLVIRERNGKIN